MDTKVPSSGTGYLISTESYVRSESQRPRLSQASAVDDLRFIDLGSQDRTQIALQIGEASRLLVEEMMELCSDDPSKRMRLSATSSTPSPFFQIKQSAILGWIKSWELGRGAQSIVYQAIPAASQRGIGEVRVIKSSRPYMSSYLEREESALKILRGCPEILQCYGGETIKENDQRVHNLLLEFAPHGTLADQINKNAMLESEARVNTRMLLKGVSRIHGRGLVHCDFKPENILLFPSSSREDGASYQLKIADFGLSKTPNEYCNTDYWKLKFRGTPMYMSPESVAFGEIDAPLDIWSLGCIVIEMITGLPPWRNHQTPKDMMRKLVYEKEAPVIPNGVSQDCRDFLNKCFMKDPHTRWNANMLLDHPFVQLRRSVYGTVDQAFSSFGHYSLFP